MHPSGSGLVAIASPGFSKKSRIGSKTEYGNVTSKLPSGRKVGHLNPTFYFLRGHMGDNLEDFLKDMKGEPIAPPPPPPPPTPPIYTQPFFQTIVTAICIIVIIGFVKVFVFSSSTTPPTSLQTQPANLPQGVWKTFQLTHGQSAPTNIPSMSCIDVIPTTLTVVSDGTKQNSSSVTITNNTPATITAEVYVYPIDSTFCKNALSK